MKIKSKSPRGAGVCRKSWADRMGYRTGVFGETHDGIRICEQNRATVYARWKSEIQELIDYLQKNYRDKGVHATLFGVETESGPMYAVFVQDGFLRELPIEADDE